MQIFIKTPSGRISIFYCLSESESLNLNVNLEDSIKHRILQLEGIPIEEQRLICGGKPFCSIPKTQSGSINISVNLHLVGGSFLMYIRVFRRPTQDPESIKLIPVLDFTIQVPDFSNTIGELREIISNAEPEECSIENQDLLIFSGKKLDNESTIDDYHISRDCTLYLILASDESRSGNSKS